MKFDVLRSNVTHTLASVPATLPMKVLMALPMVPPKEAVGGLFDLLGALNLVLGSEGWATVSKVLDPRVLALG